jgi:hypothetical protein
MPPGRAGHAARAGLTCEMGSSSGTPGETRKRRLATRRRRMRLGHHFHSLIFMARPGDRWQVILNGVIIIREVGVRSHAWAR